MKCPSFSGLKAASEAASVAKRANRQTDTRHELLLRRLLWRIGFRYRKHVASLPGKPDLVFKKAKVVVFCDGDFWHGRDWPLLKRKLRRGSNAAYWIAKISRNRERDAEHSARLACDGWHVIRVWETEITADAKAIAKKIIKVLISRLSKHRAHT